MNRPKVGIGVIIEKEGKVLLLKRQNTHGNGEWSCPGGHLEFKESWEECAKREVIEETGIEIKNIKFFAATNDIFEKENLHYITLFMKADWDSGNAEIKEPKKCSDMGWFPLNDLPEPIFTPLRNLIKQNLIR